MLTQERKALILDRLRREGRVLAKALSEELVLSEDTIRRDLRELAGEGLLQRVHGGALPASPALAPLAARESVSPAGKIAIGKAAAAMVRPGQVVLLDGGTTAIQIARQLPPGLEASFVTHSPAVALELARHPRIQVETIGGRLYRHSMVAVGAVAAEAIGRVRADLYFMGVTGIHPEIGLSTGDAEEAAIKRLLCAQAAETVVLGSREKIGAVSAHDVVGLGAVDAVIVERGADLAGLRAIGVVIVEA